MKIITLLKFRVNIMLCYLRVISVCCVKIIERMKESIFLLIFNAIDYK